MHQREWRRFGNRPRQVLCCSREQLDTAGIPLIPGVLSSGPSCRLRGGVVTFSSDLAAKAIRGAHLRTGSERRARGPETRSIDQRPRRTSRRKKLRGSDYGINAWELHGKR